MSFSRIRSLMPLAYQGETESARRKFERDKEELRALGLELKHFAPEDLLPDGRRATDHIYAPSESVHHLPELNLTEEQFRNLATLLLSALAERGDDAGNIREYELLESAAAKLLYRNPGLLESAPVGRRRENSGLLEQDHQSDANLTEIHTALQQHRWISFDYTNRAGEIQRRTVAGRGLVAHRLRWCLVAFCRDRRAIRLFYIDRMRNLMLEQQTYAPDPDFRITDYSLHPLALRSHAPRAIRLTLDSSREELFLDLIGGLPPTRPVQIKTQDDETHVELSTTNTSALFSWMIRNPGTVLKIGPREVHAEFESYLNTMRVLHAPTDTISETNPSGGQPS